MAFCATFARNDPNDHNAPNDLNGPNAPNAINDLNGPNAPNDTNANNAPNDVNIPQTQIPQPRLRRKILRNPHRLDLGPL
jgi:hypothetical protein